MKTEHFNSEVMPDYPRYQAYIESVRKNFPGFGPGQRAAMIVHQGVLIRRMLRMNAVMADFPPHLVQFMVESFPCSLNALINFGALIRSEDQVYNAIEEAYKIFREEEDHYGAQQLMLTQFEPNSLPN